MNKNDYVKKMQEVIDKGIQDGISAKTEDNTLQDLKHFQDFLYGNFNKCKPNCAVVENSENS